MSLKENVIYPNGYTSKFTYNNKDYDLIENYDKDVYEIYYKYLEDYFLNLWKKMKQFEKDINLSSQIEMLPKTDFRVIRTVYDNYVKEFNMFIGHFTVYLFTKDQVTCMEILNLFYKIHNLIEDYKESAYIWVIDKAPYNKILEIDVEPNQFINTLKKLQVSDYKDKLNKIDLDNLKKY